MQISTHFTVQQQKKKKITFVNVPINLIREDCALDFSAAPVVENPPTNAGDTGPIPGLGRFHILQGN